MIKVYENGGYWVRKVDGGFEVREERIGYSKRVANIRFTGRKGMDRARSECDFREAVSK